MGLRSDSQEQLRVELVLMFGWAAPGHYDIVGYQSGPILNESV
jgi:hypothetical protein